MTTPTDISLRDWFAGQALGGMIQKDAAYSNAELAGDLPDDVRDLDGKLVRPCEAVYPDMDSWKDVAEAAYALADAMIAARRERDGK